MNASEITNLKGRVSNCEQNLSIARVDIASNSSTIRYVNEDLTTLTNRVSTDETNITNNTTEINNIKSQLNSIPINPYEGLYSYVYDNNVRLNYNYNFGYLIYWKRTGKWFCAINDNDFLNQNTTDIILPGHVKKLNSDGTINEIISDVYYFLNAPAETGNIRQSLPNLKTITTLPDVNTLDIDILGAQNLYYFNLMNGLKIIKLKLSSTEGVYNIYSKSLRIPASVNECILSSIGFNELIFEHSTETLKLQINQCTFNDSITCKANLTSDSYIKNTSSYSLMLPIEMNVSHSFLSKVEINLFVQNYHMLSLHYPLNLDSSNNPSLPNSMTFKVIFKYVITPQTNLESGNLHATTWI